MQEADETGVADQRDQGDGDQLPSGQSSAGWPRAFSSISGEQRLALEGAERRSGWEHNVPSPDGHHSSDGHPGSGQVGSIGGSVSGGWSPKQGPTGWTQGCGEGRAAFSWAPPRTGVQAGKGAQDASLLVSRSAS